MMTLLLAMALDSSFVDLIEKSQLACLATMYKETPFTSLVGYALDDGTPVIFISELAVHTNNLSKNDKCSLMVSKQDDSDIFNSSRVTYLGKMKKLEGKDADSAKKAYLTKYPDAESLLELDDFAFYKMEIEKIYYIGGFGDINWIDLKDYQKHWAK